MLTISPYPFLIALVLIELIIAIRLRLKRTTSSKMYLSLVLLLLTSTLIEALYAANIISYQKTILFSLLWTSALASTTILLLIFSYLPPTLRLNKYWAILVFLGAITSLWFINTIDNSLLGEDGFFVGKLSFGIFSWLTLHKFFVEIVLLTAMIFIIRNLSRANYMNSPALFIGIAIAIPLYASITGHELPLLKPGLQLAIFLSSSLIIGIALLNLGNKQMFLSRNYIFNEFFVGGWVLIDTDQKIIDLNAEAQKLLGLSNVRLIRKDAGKLLARFPSIANAIDQDEEAETHTSVTIAGKPAYINAQLSRVSNKSSVQSGYILFIQDETQKRKLDIARQEARDEMFGLLHSISGAASESESLAEFVNAVLHQLTHSFQSTASLIYLGEKDATQHPLPLVGQTGIKDIFLKNISFLDVNESIITEINSQKDILVISKSQREKYLSPKLAEALRGEVLIAPLMDNKLLVGLLIICKEDQPFKRHDITRIEIAAQDVSSFINNDRRRHASSTLAERQRLIRDLHDSVTQRLYSLVMMTEAARLEFSAKKTNAAMSFIEDFGFSARQALKEMRLFLYKMQPVDMRGGFPNLLMQRLDSVEGRAGLEIDVDIDDSITLASESELHLYMIAQEALNNIIKHANANKIAVRYKRADEYISLIIHDNGHGFSTKDAHLSGLGLRNIKERAELIGGNTRFESSPEKGTSIIVVLPEKENTALKGSY